MKDEQKTKPTASFIVHPSSFILSNMPVLPIVKYGDPVLRQPTQPVTEIDEPLQKLIDDMVATMYAAPGVGLAANQVGVSKRLAVLDLSVGKKPGGLHILINPPKGEAGGAVTEEGGCPSLPDLGAGVDRPRAWQ